MNLFEYEGKQLLRRYGISVPESCLLTQDNLPAPMPYPFVLKAQVMTGGRGKAGGVKVCTDDKSFRCHAKSILEMKIKDHQVYGLLAEGMMKPQQEYYLSITQQGVTMPTLIFSRMGGMDIETVARNRPKAICRMTIDPFTHLKAYQIKQLAEMMELDVSQVRSFLKKFQAVFFQEHALLVEINPLGVVDGQLVAMDCKCVLDDYARSTTAIQSEFEKTRQGLNGYVSSDKEKTTVTYVPLDGDIGIISDGAGTGMLTLDLLSDMGAKVSCFTELGGMTSEEVMYRAMQLTLEGHPEIKGLLIVLIGGFNQMDNMARGILRYVREHNVAIPIYTRMCGTMEDEGLRLMETAGMKTYYDLTDAVKQLFQAVKGV